MGIYNGQREFPCPRCGGLVVTTFVSVAPMSFSQRCLGCDTTEFTPEEEALLNGGPLPDDIVSAPRRERTSAQVRNG